MAEGSAVSHRATVPTAGRAPGTRVGSTPERTSGPDGGYRGPQVCQLVGISYRQLDYWARTGLLRPSVAEAKGSGTKRRYSYRDLLELKVIKRLLDAGVSLQSARRAVGCLREDLGADLASANLAAGQDSCEVRPQTTIRTAAGAVRPAMPVLLQVRADFSSFSTPGFRISTSAEIA